MLKIVNQIKSTSEYVPLKQVNIESTIRSFAADVTITQIFRNDENTSIVAVYCFPIEEQAAIYNFTARIDNREIIAQLREKNHDTQINSNNNFYQKHDTYLLEQDEKSQDNFIINVGALPPSKECVIIISYVTELDLIQGSIIRFVIPATIAPRYSPQKKGSLSRLNTKYIQSTPYIIQFRCRIEKIYGPNQEQYIARLNSPSHLVDIDLSMDDAYMITFAQKHTYLDRDILLDIKLSDKRANTFIVLEPNAAMAAVTPFEEDCYLTLDSKQTNEFIFILDCSKSMKNENKIGFAREAMLLFLKNLPNNCYFNIIKFGTKYDCLFNESTAFYNSINVRIAEKFISQIRADLGGTEILAPLQWLERHPPQTDRARQVFLLTDGEVSNVSEVLELCRSMASSTRIFSFGLGATPSRSLVKGLARATNGRFVFIPPNTNIDIYIEEQLRKAIRRCITNIRVDWNLGVNVENVPNELPPAYIDDRLIIYALTNNQTIPFNHRSSIEIRTDQSYYRLGITDSDRITNNNKMIERLAAKALILQLEHCKISRTTQKKVRFEDIADNDSLKNEISQSKQHRKQRIIDLSLRYNILSPYTVFIGIEKSLTDKHINRILREVPIQIVADDQPIQSTETVLSSSRKSVDGTKATTFTNQQSVDKPVHIERTREDVLLSRHSIKNNNWQSNSPKHVPLHYHTSTPVKSSVTTQNNYSTSAVDHDENHSVTHDKNIVYYLIHRQGDDGLWHFVSPRKTIKELTGKSLSVFQSSETSENTKILVAAIIIVLLETKFIALQSMWIQTVEKARQSLIYYFNNNWQKLIVLFRNIRMILTN
ncbi:unnamed protein product [Adineta steineri]|uniref:Uncharacterized protein n=1 Tax=Adineta steineri TaxID=433720 RepID=A0A818U8N0_9BILA|nr:unnamed protein product [Adineta steineri]